MKNNSVIYSANWNVNYSINYSVNYDVNYFANYGLKRNKKKRFKKITKIGNSPQRKLKSEIRYKLIENQVLRLSHGNPLFT